MKPVMILVVILCILPLSAISHPHFFKEVRFSFDRDKDSKHSIVVSHITVPFNEIATASLPEGGDWHLGFAKLEIGVDIEMGESTLESGVYSLKVKRTSETKWSLFLVPDGKDGEDEEIPLECQVSSDLPDEDHLSISIHPVGAKDETQIVLDVRFGPNGIQVPLTRID